MPRGVRPACAAIAIAAVVFAAVLLPVGRLSMACFALGLLTLVLLRERARASIDEAHEGPSHSPPPSARCTADRPRDLIDLVEARESEERRQGYACTRFEAPLLVCPREEFEHVLARHEAAVRAQLPAILFLAAKQSRWRERYDRIEHCAAEIDLHGGTAPPRLVLRASVWPVRRFRAFLSIHDRSFGHPGDRRMRVYVCDEDAVSVRKVELLIERLPRGAVRRELVPAPDEDLIFEPVRQEVSQDGSTWLRRWRATATSPVHEERIVLRPPAATREEWVDRFFEACEHQLRRRLTVALADGYAENQILLTLTPGDEFGPCAILEASTREGRRESLEGYPDCHASLQRPWPRGWVPVLVKPGNGSFGGIRWVAVRPDADPHMRPAGAMDVWQGRVAQTRRKAR